MFTRDGITPYPRPGAPSPSSMMSSIAMDMSMRGGRIA